MTLANLPQIADRLAARRPAEVDRLLVSSAQQCGVALREVYEPRYQSMVMKAEASSLEGVEAARAKFANAMTGPTIDQLEAWLAELSVITARRQDDDQTESLRFSAYASRLSAYPADVARYALLEKRWKFFPAWIDLAEVCDEAQRQRLRMQRAMDQAEAELRDKELRKRALPTDQTKTLTDEEIAARKADTDRIAAEVIASMQARSAQQEADAAARAQEARDSYKRFRPSQEAAE